jgi:hypothetical protein
METVNLTIQQATGEEQFVAVTPCTKKCQPLDEATFGYRQTEIPHIDIEGSSEPLIGCLHRDGSVCGAELRRRTA